MKYSIVFLLIINFGYKVFSQEITNVLAKRINDGYVELKYDLTSSNKNDSLFFVELFLFQNDKLLFKIEDATGDIGFNIKPTIANKIIWNPFTKKTDLLIENSRFKLTAIPRKKEGMVLIIGGSKKDSISNLVSEIKSFYADTKEVSHSEFKNFVNEFGYKTDAETSGNVFIYVNGSFEKEEKYYWLYNTSLKKITTDDYQNHPVSFVSYNDAKKYCEWKKKRLPTDLEWEVMASNCFEPKNLIQNPTENAWFDENSSKSTHEVNSLNYNINGMYHIYGNVSEWCSIDEAASNSNQNSAPIRGGSYITSEKNVNINYRITSNPTYSYQDVGFRCVSNVIE